MEQTFGHTISDIRSACFGCSYATSLVNGLHCTLKQVPVLFATAPCEHFTDAPELAESAQKAFLFKSATPSTTVHKKSSYTTPDMFEIAQRRKETRRQQAKLRKAQQAEEKLRAQGQLSLF